MTQTLDSTRVRSALLVHAHPEPTSFSTAQATAVTEELRRHGVAVRSIDLYAEGWDPVLSRGQFSDVERHFKPQAEQLRAVANGTLADPVATHLQQVEEADLLVLSFPLWWFSMPAIMKGWVDRVFVMGAAFGGKHGTFRDGGLRGKRAVLLVTTGGSEAAFAPGVADGFGDIDTFLFHIHRGMLEFVGFDVLEPVITYGPVRLDDVARAAALTRARRRIADVLHGPQISAS